MPFYKEVSFNRQKPIGKYIVDFYSHRLKLVIEIDGDTHGETAHISYDLNRTQYLKSKGLRVLRFTNCEVLENIAGVLGKIKELVEHQDGKSP
jgi:very-short-patch-repair endonuclease